jgi:hypothetical protein
MSWTPYRDEPERLTLFEVSARDRHPAIASTNRACFLLVDCLQLLVSLTEAGRKQLEKELESWARLSAAINLVIQEA